MNRSTVIPSLGKRFARRRGVALIVVLSGLVLLTVLVLGFLGSVSTELQSSKVYASGSSVKLLAQSAVDLVIAEIRDATADPKLCWVSQPGMIRVYDDTGQNSGDHVSYYKLYSDSEMIGTGTFDSATTLVPANWYEQKGVYVDLNQPVTVNGVNRYPIITGDSADLAAMTASGGIAGFFVTGAPLDARSPNRVPMPVRWLYVLRDGQLATPDKNPGGGSTVTFTAGNIAPSAANPIVGRIAFWTDDETCKVNINTASEAANPWDIPRLNTEYDKKTMSLNQPVQHEFQRYPGHPATVCLSAVLGTWLPVPSDPFAITTGTYQNQLKPYYDLSPRVVAGIGESISSGSATASAGNSSQGGAVAPATTSVPLTPDTDRLYTSVDELVFAPGRTVNNPALTQTQLEKARFFLTAHSRAPDVNLFNQPRVGIWPIAERQNSGGMLYRSPVDQLIAFCTTANDHIYYFQRRDPNDQRADLPTTGSATGVGRNRMLLEYLRYFINQPVPGLGGSLAEKYNDSDTVGGSGIVSGTKECDQILTEIFDYIRSTNTRDQSLAAGSTNPITPYTVAFNSNYNAGTGQVVPILDGSNSTRGLGRFPTLQQAALIFYASNDNGASPPKATQLRAFLVLSLFDPSLGYPYSVPWYQIEISGLNNFTWNGTAPMFSNSSAILTFPYGGAMNQDPMVGGTMSFRRVMYNYMSTLQTNSLSAPATGSLISEPFPASNPSNLPLEGTAPGLGLTGINFTGGPITISFRKIVPNGSVSATTTGVVDSSPVQTITVTFPNAPSGGFKLPELSPAPASPIAAGYEHVPSGSGATHQPGWESWGNRFKWMTATSSAINWGFNSVTSDNDTIRAIVPTPGDMRLIAARQEISAAVGEKFFQAHPAYAQPVRMAHNLQTSYGNPAYQASMTTNQGSGALVPLAYHGSTAAAPGSFQTTTEYRSQTESAPRWPDVPTTAGVFAGGSGTVPGDWDNGIANFKDGAYINKADEGDYFRRDANNYPYYNVFAGGSSAVRQTFFSPNRMLPSAGMFGSLPTGVLGNKPWQTLLFRPGPKGHAGLGSPVNSPVGPPYTQPPDSALLDLFTMPVVEPYAISEPFSTAGRINMNYQIVPFTYIKRSTGMQAVLKSVQLVSIPDSASAIYKYNDGSGPNPNGANTYRQKLNIAATLDQFEARFSNRGVFRSPSEICSIDLVPSDYSGSTASPGSAAWRTALDNYWSTHRPTGDNTRERPYANLYPLLTTKSNTFTVHFRVQTLQPVTGAEADPTRWREDRDVITGEYRGSQTVERYVDPAGDIPDYAANPTVAPSQPLSQFYKFRAVSAKQFAP